MMDTYDDSYHVSSEVFSPRQSNIVAVSLFSFLKYREIVVNDFIFYFVKLQMFFMRFHLLF